MLPFFSIYIFSPNTAAGKVPIWASDILLSHKFNWKAHRYRKGRKWTKSQTFPALLLLSGARHRQLPDFWARSRRDTLPTRVTEPQPQRTGSYWVAGVTPFFCFFRSISFLWFHVIFVSYFQAESVMQFSYDWASIITLLLFIFSVQIHRIKSINKQGNDFTP